jgi:TonB family protein
MLKHLPSAVIVVLAMLATPAMAQPELPRSLGELPPSFQLPEAGTPVQFTSMLNPEFVTPAYPEQHKTARFEGVAEVRLYVSSAGEVLRCEITVSSGDAAFDDASLRSGLKTRFPAGYATVRGVACDFTTTVPYYFLLSPDPEQYWHSRLELARIQQEYESLMKQYEGILAPQGAAADMQRHRIERQLEQTVTLAKQLHRSLAEKKESAILRLRDEITMTKQILQEPATASSMDASATSWRTEQTPVIPTVIIPGGMKGVASTSALSNNELDRLMSELELKQSYL